MWIFVLHCLLSNIFKTFLAIRAPGVVTEVILDSSPSLFSSSFDSPSTWEFLDDVWELPCTMFEDLNLPFHGMLLDPLIEDYCGPLINCDSCSTFDETSPFLASPASVTFSGEYQLTISSNTTSLLTCNFRVKGLKHLYPFCFKEYPMKIHFSAFGSSFDPSRWEHARMQCNQTLWGVKHWVSCLWIFLQGSCHELPLWVFDSWCRLQLLSLQPKSNLANSSH